MTNLNNIVFFIFCRSLYRYITTVYIFCQTEAANLHIVRKSPIELLFVDITCTGANITMSDLSHYQVHIYPALSVSLHSGHVIHTLRPPSSGAILAFMLRVLEGELHFYFLPHSLGGCRGLITKASYDDLSYDKTNLR